MAKYKDEGIESGKVTVKHFLLFGEYCFGERNLKNVDLIS